MSRKRRPPDPDIEKAGGKRHDRTKKHLLGSHVTEDVFWETKILVAKLGLNTDLVMHEALGFLFRAYHVPIPRSLMEKLLIVLERAKHDDNDDNDDDQ